MKCLAFQGCGSRVEMIACQPQGILAAVIVEIWSLVSMVAIAAVDNHGLHGLETHAHCDLRVAKSQKSWFPVPFQTSHAIPEASTTNIQKAPTQEQASGEPARLLRQFHGLVLLSQSRGWRSCWKRACPTHKLGGFDSPEESVECV